MNNVNNVNNVKDANNTNNVNDVNDDNDVNDAIDMNTKSHDFVDTRFLTLTRYRWNNTVNDPLAGARGHEYSAELNTHDPLVIYSLTDSTN